MIACAAGKGSGRAGTTGKETGRGMGITFTDTQRQVIETRGCNLLVSAAAGSGKTAVLVERIVETVCGGENPVDVDRLLVVTFTNAAAAQMRERVSRALSDRLALDPGNEHIQRQTTLLYNAQITTIDSFCLFVLRNQFHTIGLDPGFRIAEEGELKLLRADVLGAVIEDAYGRENPEFLHCMEYFSVGNRDEAVEKEVIKLYDFAMSMPFPEAWLAQRKGDYQVTGDPLAFPWAVLFMEHVRLVLAGCVEKLEAALGLCEEPDGPYFYGELLEKEREMAAGLLRLCGGNCAGAENGSGLAGAQGSGVGQTETTEAGASGGGQTETADYDALCGAFGAVAFGRLPSKRDASVSPAKREAAKALRDSVKEALSELRTQFFGGSSMQVSRQMEGCQEAVSALVDLTLSFKAAFDEAKREKNILDFDDIEHLALQILLRGEGDGYVPTETALAYRSRFHEILIDEYQDSNLIQEIILNSVSRREAGSPNVFMVGDVKQSIYRFRLARPELFMEKYHTYPRTEEGPSLRIDLHRNFRSRREVLTGVNEIFYRLMTPGVGGIRYDEAAALYLGSSMPEPEDDMNRPELLLLDGDAPELSDGEKELTVREMEAYAAAERIRGLLAHQQVWDAQREVFRPASYGDIVILLRSLTGWGDVYAKVLTEAGIPAHTESRTGYFTTVEIQTLLNLLRVVDNPRQDIPLAAVLKSMIGGFTDVELALIKSRYPDRPFYEACMCFWQERTAEEINTGKDSGSNTEDDTVLEARMKAFYEKLNRYRSKADYLPIHEFLWFVLEDTGYGDYLAAQPGGQQREANVRMLIERAIAFEKTSYRGLFHFVRYMEQLQSYQEDFGEAGITGENEDAVRIMTIHKSKGLEFPIVIVGGLGKSFNRQDTRSRVVLHPDLGLGADYMDAVRRVKIPLLPKKVLQRALDLEMLGEELRVLYVAFTRAKEKLILLGSAKKLDEKLEGLRGTEGRGPLPFSTIASAGTYLDWILPASAGSSFALSRVQPELLIEEAVGRQISMEELRERLRHPEDLPGGDEAFAEEIGNRFAEVYPYEEDISLRVKVSVSELKTAGQTEEEDADTLLYPQEEIVPYIPRFMQEEEPVSGAARGTAYHRVLECLGPSGFRHSDKVREAVERLVEEGRLTRAQADVVRPYDIYAFGKTDLAKRMTAAKRRGQLYTEQPFVIKLPACELELGYKSREPVLIQGIIDAYFYEEDGIVVVDYKTDYVKQGEELRKKYGQQLDYYEAALEMLTGKRVKEKVIYSFCLGEPVPVELRRSYCSLREQ